MVVSLPVSRATDFDQMHLEAICHTAPTLFNTRDSTASNLRVFLALKKQLAPQSFARNSVDLQLEKKRTSKLDFPDFRGQCLRTTLGALRKDPTLYCIIVQDNYTVLISVPVQKWVYTSGVRAPNRVTVYSTAPQLPRARSPRNYSPRRSPNSRVIEWGYTQCIEHARNRSSLGSSSAFFVKSRALKKGLIAIASSDGPSYT